MKDEDGGGCRPQSPVAAVLCDLCDLCGETLALSSRQRVLVVVHCDRGEAVRIIAARRYREATKVVVLDSEGGR